MTLDGLISSYLCIMWSLYGHRPIDHTLELDVCLTGLGGRWCSFVYHLPISEGYMSWSIVHLERVKVLLAVRLFQTQWAGRKVLIKCDNEAVVTVLRSSDQVGRETFF